MATVESDEMGKQYLFELYGIPLASWVARYVSEDKRQVDIWVSPHCEGLASEEPGTRFTLERVSVLRSGLSPERVAGVRLRRR